MALKVFESGLHERVGILSAISSTSSSLSSLIHENVYFISLLKFIAFALVLLLSALQPLKVSVSTETHLAHIILFL